jgi:hypothetical protein
MPGLSGMIPGSTRCACPLRTLIPWTARVAVMWAEAERLTGVALPAGAVRRQTA